MKRSTASRLSTRGLLAGLLFLPFLCGASCSTNDVAESAATAFFTSVASQFADVLFTGLAGN